MTMRTIGLMFLAAVASLGLGCSQPATTPGPDQDTGSNASMVSWRDGKQAIAITCEEPAGCQRRAQAMCPSGYAVLASENMPVAFGTARAMPDRAASTTIRCR